MKICLQFICVLVLLNFAGFANAQSVGKPKLRQKLLDKLKEDQKVRNEIPDDPSKITSEYITRLQSVDRTNTKWMKKIVKKYGFPAKSLVCDDGVYAAFILVQHADLDREFQKSVLPLLEKAVRAKEAPAFYFVYLADRVLTGEGKLQRYGSQLKIEDGKVVPFPIEDEANVDKRRTELGLPLMSEYLKGQKTLEPPQCRPPNNSTDVRAKQTN